VHLKSTGLFDILRAHGVDVDDRGVHSRTDPKVILPVTHFVSTSEAERITNHAFDNLRSANLAGGNLTPVVTELFSELAQNAAQHSESEIGAFACIRFLEASNNARFTCAVADGGIGVRRSLLKNPALQSRVSYDWDALELAVLERISGTGDPHRGIGLFGVREDLRSPGRTLLLHSGLGSLQIREDLQSQARRTRLFPGTLAYLTIPA
jgi:hypothetical protein